MRNKRKTTFTSGLIVVHADPLKLKVAGTLVDTIGLDTVLL